jgi:hypothetical protein
VWEQLSGLVRDAAWLESYIVATMLLVKETMQVWQGGGGGAWGRGLGRRGCVGGEGCL